MTSRPTASTAAAISTTRTISGSCCARRTWAPVEKDATGLRAPRTAPSFEEFDGDQHRKGDDQQHGGDCRRLRVGEPLEPRDDEHRGNLGAIREIAGHEHDRAVLAQAARE